MGTVLKEEFKRAGIKPPRKARAAVAYSAITMSYAHLRFLYLLCEKEFDVIRKLGGVKEGMKGPRVFHTEDIKRTMDREFNEHFPIQLISNAITLMKANIRGTSSSLKWFFEQMEHERTAKPTMLVERVAQQSAAPAPAQAAPVEEAKTEEDPLDFSDVAAATKQYTLMLTVDLKGATVSEAQQRIAKEIMNSLAQRVEQALSAKTGLGVTVAAELEEKFI